MAADDAALFCDVYRPVEDFVLALDSNAVLANEGVYLEQCLGMTPPGGAS